MAPVADAKHKRRHKPPTARVYCNAGGTVARALAAADPNGPATIQIHGTCYEFVDVHGFEGLTLQGVGDAAIVAPSEPANYLDQVPLGLRNSRDILVSDLAVRSAGLGAYTVATEDCQDCQIAHTRIEGVTLVTHKSRIRFVDDVFDAGSSWAALAVTDNSVVHMGQSLLLPGSNGPGWQSGLDVLDGGIVKFWGTTIQGFPNCGVTVTGGSVHMYDVSVLFPDTDPGDPTVVIADNAQCGIRVTAGGRAEIRDDARLRNNGTMGGAAVVATQNSIVTMGRSVEIWGSPGNGLMLEDGSRASIAGRIVDTMGNGLVVVNSSSATAGDGAEISGSGSQDVFCDATSIVSGASRIGGAAKLTCPNLNPGDHVPLP
jgi:hypothetical protein